MRSLQAALICASFVLSLVTAIPTVDLTIAHDVARSPSTVALAAGPAVTHYYDVDGNRLATIKATDKISDEDLNSLAVLANDQIITEAFNTAAKITEVVCTKAGPTACIATALVAVIGVFFLAWKSSGRRELDHVFLVDYPPAAGYSTRYRLENEAPEGDWRLIGNATVNGVFHTIHYKRNGTLNGLRSVQYGSVEGVSKRAEDNDGGVVVDYNWDSLSETAYNSFDSTQTLINDFSNDIAADLEDANSIQGCADFADSDGYLDAGLVSIGWNNVPFQFEDGQEQGQLNGCADLD